MHCTGHGWVGCHIGTVGSQPAPAPLLAVPNVTTAHHQRPVYQSLYNTPLLCGFDESIEQLTLESHLLLCWFKFVFPQELHDCISIF